MKYLKWTAIILVSIVAIIFIALKLVSKSLPEGTQGQEAEALTDKMLSAINAEAYDQLTYLEWTFRGDHHYAWNKKDNQVVVKWQDFEVKLSPDDLSGTSTKNGIALVGETHQQALETAWSTFPMLWAFHFHQNTTDNYLPELLHLRCR